MLKPMTIDDLKNLQVAVKDSADYLRFDIVIDELKQTPIVRELLAQHRLKANLRLVDVEVFEGTCSGASVDSGDEQHWEVTADLQFSIVGSVLDLFLEGSKLHLGDLPKYISSDEIYLSAVPGREEDPPDYPVDDEPPSSLLEAIASRYADQQPVDEMWDDIKVDASSGDSLQQQMLDKHPLSLWQQHVAEGFTIDGYIEWAMRRAIGLPTTTPEDVNS